MEDSLKKISQIMLVGFPMMIAFLSALVSTQEMNVPVPGITYFGSGKRSSKKFMIKRNFIILDLFYFRLPVFVPMKIAPGRSR